MQPNSRALVVRHWTEEGLPDSYRRFVDWKGIAALPSRFHAQSLLISMVMPDTLATSPVRFRDGPGRPTGRIFSQKFPDFCGLGRWYAHFTLWVSIVTPSASIRGKSNQSEPIRTIEIICAVPDSAPLKCQSRRIQPNQGENWEKASAPSRTDQLS